MTRLECSTLRCLAIVSIMIHNFCHWLPGAAQENEFSFNVEHYYFFWDSLMGKDFLIQIFSFFGHLGVPVFVFLTGYGLSQKYDRIECVEWKSFLYDHWKKLFIPLVVGTLAYLFVMYLLEGNLVCSITRIVVQFTMLLNIISPMHLLPMPYWYLGMTMQLYIIYLLFVHNRSLMILLVLTIVSLIFMACLVGYPQAVVLSKFNFIGWLVPLYMGITFSRNQTIFRVERGVLLIVTLGMSLVATLLCGFNYFTWLLIPLFIVVMAVGIVKYLPIDLQEKMDFMGRNSLYLLIVHPITRELILPLISSLGGYISLLLYMLTTFIFVHIFLFLKNRSFT